MTDESLGATLLKNDLRDAGRTAVLTPTYPMDIPSAASMTDALPHLAAARVELRTGNMDAAIAMTRLVSGRAARLGNYRVASLLRRAVWIAPFGQIDSADELMAQAETALRSY